MMMNKLKRMMKRWKAKKMRMMMRKNGNRKQKMERRKMRWSLNPLLMPRVTLKTMKTVKSE
jgi:hypothetical protein